MRVEVNVVFVGVLVLVATAAVLVRALGRTQDRGAWIALAVALAANAAGAITLAGHTGELPFPSLADAFLLAFFPAAFVAAVLFARARLARFGAALVLDALIGTLGAAAVVTQRCSPTSAPWGGRARVPDGGHPRGGHGRRGADAARLARGPGVAAARRGRAAARLPSDAVYFGVDGTVQAWCVPLLGRRLDVRDRGRRVEPGASAAPGRARRLAHARHAVVARARRRRAARHRPLPPHRRRGDLVLRRHARRRARPDGADVRREQPSCTRAGSWR